MTENSYGLNRTLGFAIAIIALVALLGGGGVLITLQQLQDATASRYRSARILSGLDAFRSAILNQETGVRGYLLTGHPSSLQPYEAGRVDLDRAVVRLRAEIDGQSDQVAPLRDAEGAARAWQQHVGAAIVRDMADPATRDRARAIEASGEGKAMFDTLRRRLGAIERQERASLDQQTARVARAERLAQITLWASLLVTLMICVAVGVAINRMVVQPLSLLATTMGRLMRRDTSVAIPSLRQRNEVGAMARAVEVFRNSLIELDRTSLLRMTADTMPAMIGYIGADRTVGFLNDEFAKRFDLGHDDVAQASGRALEQLFPRSTFPGASRELAAAMGGEETRFAFQLVEGAGSRDFEGYFRPHRGQDGQVQGVVVLFTDVTDRKEIDRTLRHQAHDLQRSNEELEQFAYVASHDLKAPLRGIENLASWIEEDLGDKLEGDTRTNMNLLRSRVRRLESLLSDLLAYSRAGRTDNVVREVDTRALVEELAVLVSPPEGFRVAASPDLPTIPAMQAALAQVIQNLIGNAIKHHPDPARGLVRVTAERRDGLIEFQVADNGGGIPAQFRERVFGMFQTLKPRDEVEGSGMGLAIVKKLVERQAGKVWLSEGEAGGLVVHFTWPAVPKGL